MTIFGSLKSGCGRTLRSMKGTIIIWFAFLLLTFVVAIPLKSSLKSSFGDSMITDRLKNGFDVEIFGELGPVLKNLFSYVSSGFMIVFLAGFVLNAFLTGGLFYNLSKESKRFSSGDFFRSGADNFWSFLIITLIVNLIIVFLSFMVALIPMLIVGASIDTISEKNMIVTALISFLSLLAILPILLLVADYSRAWKVINRNASGFKAVRFGFTQTFRRFWSSYFIMIILVLSQFLFAYIGFRILPVYRPVTGVGVFGLLFISQTFVFIRLLLKTWRYASVTDLMERSQMSDLTGIPVSSQQQIMTPDKEQSL